MLLTPAAGPLAHHLEGLGDPGGKDADKEKDEQGRPEAHGGLHAEGDAARRPDGRPPLQDHVGAPFLPAAGRGAQDLGVGEVLPDDHGGDGAAGGKVGKVAGGQHGGRHEGGEKGGQQCHHPECRAIHLLAFFRSSFLSAVWRRGGGGLCLAFLFSLPACCLRGSDSAGGNPGRKGRPGFSDGLC